MVHGYHLILPTYGFWLPNDPRGSWSESVRKWELVRFGTTTKTLPRRTLDELTPRKLPNATQLDNILLFPLSR
jgi:hypothetical protein